MELIKENTTSWIATTAWRVVKQINLGNNTACLRACVRARPQDVT